MTWRDPTKGSGELRGRRANDSLSRQFGRLDWSPTCTQGVSVSATADVAYAARTVDRVSVWGTLTVTSAGTAGQPIQVSVPKAITSAWPGTHYSIGSGYVLDQSTGFIYLAVVYVYDEDTFTFGYTASTGNSYIGNDPSFALASGDRIDFHATYLADF